jgi:Right handed beta helix region
VAQRPARPQRRGISISELRFAGGNAASGGSGIAFLSDAPKPLEGIGVTDVEVSGYTNPVFVFALKKPAQFKGIRIERVSVHDNAQGPVLFGWLGRASTLDGNRFGLQDIVVRRLHSFRNTGADLRGGYGAGLVVLNADRVRIERNMIHDNGGANPEKTPNGPSGITVYDARNLVVQENEVFHQRYDVKNQTDNSGMDIWARNALIQYNYVHDNEGWGFVFGSSDPKVTGPGVSWLSSDVTMRYNVAENNGRRLPKSEATIKYLLATVLMFGQIERFEVHNNTFFRAGNVPQPSHPDLVQGMIYLVDVPGTGRPWANVHFRNNVFIGEGDPRLIEVFRPDVGTDLRFEGNAYVSSSAGRGVLWSGQAFTDVATWSAATGQESVAGRAVSSVAGLSAFCAAGKGRASAYRLRGGSPLVDSALDLRSAAGMKVGRRDFFGNRIPAGAGFDVGAHEYRRGDNCR